MTEPVVSCTITLGHLQHTKDMAVEMGPWKVARLHRRIG